jgi:hypothetical protein
MTISNFGTGPAGVTVSVDDGFVQGTTIGRPQKLIVFAPGDLVTAEADPNTPTALRFRPDADRLFGEGSELAEEMRAALDAGAQKRTQDQDGEAIQLLYGVMPDVNAVTGETIAGGAGTLANFPIVENQDDIDVTAAVDGTNISVDFVYEETPETPTEADTMAINPNNGAAEASDNADYEVDYKWHDWANALEAARDVIKPTETGTWGVCAAAEAVTSLVTDWMDTLREPYRMVRSVVGAQPNATGPEGEPQLNVFDDSGTVVYSHPFDDDATFMAGNARRPSGRTIVGGIAGTMAGNQLSDPLFGDAVKGYTEGTVQTLRPDERDELARMGVIPIGNTGKRPTLEDSCSTYQYASGDYLEPDTLETWPRDYYRRRVIDQVILMGNAAGRFGRKRELDNDTLQLVKEQFVDDIETFIEAGLLQTGTPVVAETGTDSVAQTPDSTASETTDDQQGYSVEVVALEVDTIGIAATVTPTNVTKHADIRLSIARQQTQGFAEAA